MTTFAELHRAIQLILSAYRSSTEIQTDGPPDEIAKARKDAAQVKQGLGTLAGESMSNLKLWVDGVVSRMDRAAQRRLDAGEPSAELLSSTGAQWAMIPGVWWLAVDSLAADCPARSWLPDEELYLLGGRRVLVLPSQGFNYGTRPVYEKSEVVRQTTSWRESQRRAEEERERAHAHERAKEAALAAANPRAREAELRERIEALERAQQAQRGRPGKTKQAETAETH